MSNCCPLLPTAAHWCYHIKFVRSLTLQTVGDIRDIITHTNNNVFNGRTTAHHDTAHSMRENSKVGSCSIQEEDRPRPRWPLTWRPASWPPPPWSGQRWPTARPRRGRPQARPRARGHQAWLGGSQAPTLVEEEVSKELGLGRKFIRLEITNTRRQSTRWCIGNIETEIYVHILLINIFR